MAGQRGSQKHCLRKGDHVRIRSGARTGTRGVVITEQDSNIFPVELDDGLWIWKVARNVEIDENLEAARRASRRSSLGAARRSQQLQLSLPPLGAEVMDAVKKLDDPHEHHRFDALMRLQQLEPHILAVIGPSIAKCLNDESSSIAWLAVKTLAKMRPEDFSQHAMAMAGCIKAAHPMVRHALAEVMARLGPHAPELDKAKQDCATRWKSDASQVRVWLLKREEERQAKEAQEYAKILAEREREAEETRRKREQWEAQKEAEKKAMEAEKDAERKKAHEESAEKRAEKEAKIQKALDEKAEAVKEVAVDLEDKERDAIARKLQEAKELAEAKKKMEAPKEKKPKDKAPGAKSAREKAAEKNRQRQKK